MLPYIDIHTHQLQANENTFQLLNCIIGEQEFSNQICSVGIHPWYVNEDRDGQFGILKRHTADKNVLAIGECGLDKITDTTWQTQIEVFEKQILLAQELQKPLIIHCVRAYQEVFHILKEKQVTVPVIFHGFNKKLALAQSILQQGYYISLGSSILQGNQDDLIQSIDMDKIFLETDNKPTDVADIYSYFCRVRKISISDLQEQIVENFEQVFRYNTFSG